eukprot:TRINITY_DN5088_c0_g1_i1.p1 TRINITY_DN5088_c0_g1~~TRINITY_DN5088_c0_g1_i1.p1  ORF type:complete len:896 (-),score=159.66 TRINITY_DN5088_c0_g1_i1:56-2743(-)
MSSRTSSRSLAAAAGRNIVGLGTGASEATRISAPTSQPASRANSSQGLGTGVSQATCVSGSASRPASRANGSWRPSNTSDLLPVREQFLAHPRALTTPHRSAKASDDIGAKDLQVGLPRATGANSKLETRVALDDEQKTALRRVFAWCDADSDGVLNAAEFAAAQRLVAELSPEFDNMAATSIWDSVKNASSGGLVDENSFFQAMHCLTGALKLPRKVLLQGILRQTSGHSSHFDRSVSDLKHALVRNVSSLPGDDSVMAPPPPGPLWRTATGSSTFLLPPGAAGGPAAARVAFKLMQYLAMRTEDCTIIDSELAAKMMGHRRMFKDMLDMTGDICGVHVVAPGSKSTVDLFLMKSPDAEQLFRVRVIGLQLSPGPDLRLVGMGNFDAGPVQQSDIPASLWNEICVQTAVAQSAPEETSLTAPPPPASLERQSSMLGDADLQDAALVLAAVPVARHLFRIKLNLESQARPATHYVMLLPRLKTAEVGHVRYGDHRIAIKQTGSVGCDVKSTSFKNFVISNIQGAQLSNMVIEHEFTAHRVRLQTRAVASASQVMPVPDLSAEERACNLGDDASRAASLRATLDSQGLGRRSGERDIAFAVRLGKALCSGYAYDVAITDSHVRNLPTLIWEQRRGDCSAFNAGFVYALRAFGIPARVSLGFKYGRAVAQACGSVVAPHAEAEFFAEGIGWVPCDATLGLRRLGHDASSALSFVEWRPATMSVAEAQELARVLQMPQDPWQQLVKEGLQNKLEKLINGQVNAKELSAALSTARGISESASLACVDRVMELLGETVQLSTDTFVKCLAAMELGTFRELGTGGGLSETSRAGVKMFEGGPWSGDPLDPKQMKECMMVPEQMHRIMEHVGAENTVMDWSAMWPYGVFTCSYEFEEKPILP